MSDTIVRRYRPPSIAGIHHSATEDHARLCAPPWKSVFLGSVIFVLTFFGGITLVVFRAAAGLSFATPLVLLVIMFLMGAMKSHLRLRAVNSIVLEPEGASPASTLAHMTLWPFASALYLYNAIAASVSNQITWRGITYELKSPNETALSGTNSSRLDA